VNVNKNVTKPDDAADIADALGLGETIEYRGMAYALTPLDMFDVMLLLRRFGSIERVDIVNDPEAIAYVAYLMLRKADPRLSDNERDNRLYRMTPAAAAALFSVTSMDGQGELLVAIQRTSGLVRRVEPEPAPKNEPAPRAKRNIRGAGSLSSSASE